MWILLALISALATGAVATISKAGMKNVDSSAAFAVQSVVIVVVTWLYAGLTGKLRGIPAIEPKAWVSLLLAGLVSSVAYLFYFAAIKSGDVSRVAPLDRLSLVFAIIFAGLFLSEKINAPTIFGASLMAIGALVIAVGGGGGK